MTVRLPMAKGMRIGVAVVLACLVGLSGGCALARQAKRRPGTNVVVLQTGGTKIRGELVGVRSDGIVLDTKKGPAAVPTSEIESLWTVKRMSKEGRTALAVGGLLGGIALGVGAAKASNLDPNSLEDAIGLGSLFLLGGMLAGEGIAVLIATKTHKGVVYDFRDKSPEEVEMMLTDLKKLARVPDYR